MALSLRQVVCCWMTLVRPLTSVTKTLYPYVGTTSEYLPGLLASRMSSLDACDSARVLLRSAFSLPRSVWHLRSLSDAEARASRAWVSYISTRELPYSLLRHSLAFDSASDADLRLESAAAQLKESSLVTGVPAALIFDLASAASDSISDLASLGNGFTVALGKTIFSPTSLRRVNMSCLNGDEAGWTLAVSAAARPATATQPPITAMLRRVFF